MRDWLRHEIGRAPAAYAVLCVLLISFLAYANSLEGGFHFDDRHHVVRNPYVQDLKYAPEFFSRPEMFSGIEGHAMYRPLVMLSFSVNYQMGGYHPLVWRLTAIALHAFCAVGVFLTVRLITGPLLGLSDKRANAGALVAALSFALHPVFTESVNYASARSSLMAAGFGVWAFWLHHLAQSTRRRGWRLLWWTLSLALFAAGLMAKEIIVVYPALLLWAAFLQRRGYAAVLPAAVLALFYLWVRQTLLGAAVLDFGSREASMAQAEPGSGGSRPIAWNLFTQARVIAAYVMLFAWPFGLCVHRHVRVSQTPWEAGVIAGALLIAGILWLAWRLRRKNPLVSLGLFWFLIALAPTSSIVPLNQIMNERRLYLPGVGMAFVVGGLVPLLWRRRSIFLPAALATAVAAMAVTLDRNRDWRDSFRLWSSAIRVSPDSAGAWNSYAVELTHRRDFDGAAKALDTARGLEPRFWPAIYNTGWVALQRGRQGPDLEELERAEHWLDKALQRHPESEQARWSVAEVYYAQGRTEKAEAAFHELACLGSRLFEMSRYPLAQIALDRGDEKGALAFYEEALERGRNPVPAYLGMARLALERGKRREALAMAKRAMQARPHSYQPHLFLARLHKGTPLAVRHFFEAQQRGFRAHESERGEILGVP
ncbi:MAG: tetratricopeptide repeat protein [Planctomycetota bacterium]|jgi:tetratricopeptide (TPR) repeat protein